ncbi:MAG: hypothetical protein IJ515_04060 [Clostridia bacterium]|nr:hypothetical protein [Clostridia bacterium]
MKKIFAIILALTCAFAMFACSGDDATAYQTDAADFISAIESTQVTKLNVTVTADTELGTLTSTYTTEYAADGTSTMTYAIEKFLGADATEEKGVDEGTVTCDANGNYSDGGAVSGKLGATGVSFDADSEKITQYEISGETLTVVVPAADTAAVLGYEIATDAIIVVTKADGKITDITLSYTGVTVICSYNK